MLPHDQRERDRLDMMNTMLKVARPAGNRFTHCPTGCLEKQSTPLGERPRILDLGCGTGIWMNEMAEQYPGAEFVGVDIHHMGPPSLPVNVAIRAPWDYEGPWALGERSWDQIRLQMGLGSVCDWPALYRKILTHLVPGTGWFESVELDFQPRCDDGSLMPGRLIDWWESYIRGQFAAVNRPFHYDPNTGDMLKAAGFAEIHHAVYRIPLNEWSEDKAERRAGNWWRVVMSPLEDNTGGAGLEAMSLLPLCKISSWSVEHVKRLCNEALKQADDPSVHAYNELHIWWARAPGDEVP